MAVPGLRIAQVSGIIGAENFTMPQNLTAAKKESAYVLDLIGKKTLTAVVHYQRHEIARVIIPAT